MKQRDTVEASLGAAPQSLPPCPCNSSTKAKQAQKIRQIREALVAEGYLRLEQQARVLGLTRSTTHSILQARHKASGLQATVINRILSSPELPSSVAKQIHEYVQEKCAGQYGHRPAQLERFRAQLLPLKGSATRPG